MTGTASREELLTAIRDKCIDCMGSDPGVRRRIRACRTPECSLFPFRPYQDDDGKQFGLGMDRKDGAVQLDLFHG